MTLGWPPAYDDLLDQKDVEFHLAYIANLKATFTLHFKMMFDNRRQFFEGGAERVGTLLLWHFVEEIEHRSSALRIHHHVTPDPWYRIRKAPTVFNHVAGIYKVVLAGFEQHVPLEDRLISTVAVSPKGLWLTGMTDRMPAALRRARNYPSMLGHVAGPDLRTMVWQLAKSQTPHHDPSAQPLPLWVNE